MPSRYVRINHEGSACYGLWEGDAVELLDGDPFTGATPTGQQVRLTSADLLVPEILSYSSRYVTFLPGEAVATGDVIEVQIEGVGTLRNQVR
jgi:2-keto-4-pentenoate hydratase/2-oxohepta-3-ene-1,7-dioic acid hydratase in catechol pathway